MTQIEVSFSAFFAIFIISSVCHKIPLNFPKYHLRFTWGSLEVHLWSSEEEALLVVLLYFLDNTWKNLQKWHGKFSCRSLRNCVSSTFKKGRHSKVLWDQFKMETHYWEYVYKQKYTTFYLNFLKLIIGVQEIHIEAAHLYTTKLINLHSRVAK